MSRYTSPPMYTSKIMSTSRSRVVSNLQKHNFGMNSVVGVRLSSHDFVQNDVDGVSTSGDQAVGIPSLSAPSPTSNMYTTMEHSFNMPSTKINPHLGDAIGVPTPVDVYGSVCSTEEMNQKQKSKSTPEMQALTYMSQERGSFSPTTRMSTRSPWDQSVRMPTTSSNEHLYEAIGVPIPRGEMRDNQGLSNPPTRTSSRIPIRRYIMNITGDKPDGKWEDNTTTGVPSFIGVPKKEDTFVGKGLVGDPIEFSTLTTDGSYSQLSPPSNKSVRKSKEAKEECRKKLFCDLTSPTVGDTKQSSVHGMNNEEVNSAVATLPSTGDTRKRNPQLLEIEELLHCEGHLGYRPGCNCKNKSAFPPIPLTTETIPQFLEPEERQFSENLLVTTSNHHFNILEHMQKKMYKKAANGELVIDWVVKKEMVKYIKNHLLGYVDCALGNIAKVIDEQQQWMSNVSKNPSVNTHGSVLEVQMSLRDNLVQLSSQLMMGGGHLINLVSESPDDVYEMKAATILDSLRSKLLLHVLPRCEICGNVIEKKTSRKRKKTKYDNARPINI